MKNEFMMILISFLMAELNKEVVAVFALIAAMLGIVNRVYELKRNIDENHDGNIRKYLKSFKLKKLKSNDNKTKDESQQIDKSSS